MPEPSTIWVFSLAAIALIVVPGPAVLYIVAQSAGLSAPHRAVK